LRRFRIRSRVRRWQQNRLLAGRMTIIEKALRAKLTDPPAGHPVLFFNASTRTHSLSLNAAFSLLASLAVRSRGVPVRYLVCRAGMQQCMLATSWRNPHLQPPCKQCMRLSEQVFPEDLSIGLPMHADVAEIMPQLEGRSLPELIAWEHAGVPFGRLCIPTLRWAMRIHHLGDTAVHRELMRKYLVSAVNLHMQFQRIFQEQKPRALVVFNGTTYPEAVARHTAVALGIPVITHEVGLRPHSAFFTDRDATFREVHIPDSFQLGKEENDRLDRYLEARWKGKFTMAGIQFWPQMEDLPDEVDVALERHEQMVVVFPNVIFDTSQVHANVVFEHMFAWLDEVLAIADEHPRTLFVIRAHPDEDRPGKASRESVAMWAADRGVCRRKNLLFYAPSVYVSSYELIRQAKFSLVYNSSIGLEASIMGKPLICAGRGRYTQAETVYFPTTRKAYRKLVEDFLEASEVEQPPVFIKHARRFLYYELYKASLDFSRLLEPYPGKPGFVTVAVDPILHAIQDGLIEWRIIADGILEGGTFSYPA